MLHILHVYIFIYVHICAYKCVEADAFLIAANFLISNFMCLNFYLHVYVGTMRKFAAKRSQNKVLDP